MGIFLKDLDKHYTYDSVGGIFNRTGVVVQAIKTISVQSGTLSATSQVINIPTGFISAGNIICICFAIRYNPGGSSGNMTATGYVAGNGGTDMPLSGSDDSAACQHFYRVATGSEGSTLTITHNKTTASGVLNLWQSSVFVLDVGNYSINFSLSGTNLSDGGISRINFCFGAGSHSAADSMSSFPFIQNPTAPDNYTENGNILIFSSLYPLTALSQWLYYYFVNPRKQPTESTYSAPNPEFGGANTTILFTYGSLYEVPIYAT